jgi:putative flippase GtrA
MKKLRAIFQSIEIPTNFTKWLIVGFSSLILDISIFTLIFHRTEKILLSNFLAALCSTTFNYLMHYFWTFGSLTKHRDSLLRYVLNIVFLWAVGTGLIRIFVISGFSPFLSKLFSMMLVLPVNYFVLRFFVYNDKKKPKI